jgi:hypothetical protein
MNSQAEAFLEARRKWAEMNNKVTTKPKSKDGKHHSHTTRRQTTHVARDGGGVCKCGAWLERCDVCGQMTYCPSCDSGKYVSGAAKGEYYQECKDCKTGYLKPPRPPRSDPNQPYTSPAGSNPLWWPNSSRDQ